MKRTLWSVLLIVIVVSDIVNAGTSAKALQQDTGGDNGLLKMLANFDNVVIGTFEKAWRASGNGSWDTEVVVLIKRRVDGTYLAELLKPTNEFQHLTFTWRASIQAIVHTHPTITNPRPSEKDIDVANQHRVPVLTLTAKGLYAYDPVSRKVLKLMSGTDWRDSAKWQLKAESVATDAKVGRKE